MTTEQINEKAQEIVDILISHELSHDQMLDVLAMATIKLESIEHNRLIEENEKEDNISNIIRYFCGGRFDDSQMASKKILSYLEGDNKVIQSILNSDEELNNILP